VPRQSYLDKRENNQVREQKITQPKNQRNTNSKSSIATYSYQFPKRQYYLQEAIVGPDHWTRSIMGGRLNWQTTAFDRDKPPSEVPIDQTWI
jgi:hypothetical protein